MIRIIKALLVFMLSGYAITLATSGMSQRLLSEFFLFFVAYMIVDLIKDWINYFKK
jgi:hypothetical protein